MVNRSVVARGTGGWCGTLNEHMGEVMKQFCIPHHHPGGDHMTLHVSELIELYNKNKSDLLPDHLNME